MANKLDGLIQSVEAEKHRKSILYKPPFKLKKPPRQKKSAKGQMALFEENPIDHLSRKK